MLNSRLMARSGVLLFLSLMMIGKSAFAGCMTDHIREGVHLNEVRKPLYEKLSQERSKWVSSSLIFYEKLSLIFIETFKIEKNLEVEAQKLGIKFLCEEFSMSPNPGPVQWQLIKTPIQEVKINSALNLMWVLQKEIFNKNLQNYYKIVVSEIRHLEKEPRINCLSRHVLESMARIAWLGLKDVKRTELSLKLLSTMNLSLIGSQHVDKMAEPLQREGLPILCHDLPLIKFSDELSNF